jgi:hypothetical protein
MNPNPTERKRQIQLLNLQTIRVIELLEIGIEKIEREHVLSVDTSNNHHDYKRALQIMKEVQTRTTNMFYECVIPPLKTT